MTDRPIKYVDGVAVPFSDADMAQLAIDQAAASAPPAPVVPSMVSNYQARTILIQQGFFAKVDAYLRGQDQTVAANAIALQAWDYANNFYRESPFVASMGQLLGLTSAQIDQMFIAAAAITT